MKSKELNWFLFAVIGPVTTTELVKRDVSLGCIAILVVVQHISPSEGIFIIFVTKQL